MPQRDAIRSAHEQHQAAPASGVDRRDADAARIRGLCFRSRPRDRSVSQPEDARPLFLEGEAGVGKTEIAKVLASALGRRLIRLQCYEGLDVSSAVYEWNYAAQMIEIRMEEAAGSVKRDAMERNVFSERYLIRRPVARRPVRRRGAAPVFLIDELDRTDEAFEAFLLEILSDFQVTVPELGTIKAKEPPIVIITTNAHARSTTR